MKLRTAVLAAILVTVAAGAPAATAAPKKKAKKAPPPVCNLLVDTKDDVLPPDSALDVLSADLASDGKKITGVVRLAGDPDALSPTSASGRIYQLSFSGASASTNVFMSFIAAPNAQAATFGYYDQTTRINTGLGEAALKIVGNDLYMTVPIGAYSAYGKFKPGNKITGLRVTTGRMAGVFANSSAYAYNSLAGDSSDEGKTYTAGSRSCVPVGGPR